MWYVVAVSMAVNGIDHSDTAQSFKMNHHRLQFKFNCIKSS